MKKAGRPLGSTKEGLPYLNEDQLKRFLKAVRRRKRLRDDLMFSLILYFGLRVAELTHLEVEHVDWDNYGIRIEAVKKGRKRTYTEIEGALWHKLTRWLKEGRKKCQHADKSPWLFPHRLRYDQPMTTQNVKQLFKYYAKKAGLSEEFSVHSLRHTCGIQRALAGESAIEIMLWLRHREVSSTQVYFDLVEFKNQDETTKEILGKFM